MMDFFSFHIFSMLILGLRGNSGVAVLCSDTKRNKGEVAKQHLLCNRKEELRQKKNRKLWEERVKGSHPRLRGNSAYRINEK